MRRFSIRDLLWLTLVVAMGAGWWVDRGRIEDTTAIELMEARNMRDDAKREIAWLKRALENTGLEVSREGYVVRVKPFSPLLYPLLEE